MGDPAGIGPDITLQAWQKRFEQDLPVFVVVGDADLFAARAATLGLDVPIERVECPKSATQVFSRALPITHMALPGSVKPGDPDPLSVPIIVASIERSVELVQSGQADGLVTNPINKKLLYDAGLQYPGHTEFLGALAEASGETAAPLMMLVSAELRIVPATIHIPLKDIPKMLTRAHLRQTIETCASGLARDFGIASPRIAVAGLNPHAGESGSMGDEEIEIIGPAIAEAKGRNIDISGPYPADTLFSGHMRQRFDAMIAMYHDQALIPIKTLAFDTAVNVTLGLSFVRTSPDHGTAFELAGSGAAKPSSLIAALKLAREISRHRKAYAA